MSRSQRNLFKDKEHLVRMAGIFAAGITLFFVLQVALVPETFGRYGHYRASAIGEEMRRPMTYAGRASCERCHADVAEVKKNGKHVTLGCEGCHGPLLKHAAAPAAHKPSKPDTKTLCPACHEKNLARPQWLKQVDAAEHASGEACSSCHQPHAPQMEGAGS